MLMLNGTARIPSPPVRTRQRIAKALVFAVTLLALALTPLARPVSASAAGAAPCDLYAAGGTPCVAAHSTTRALFAAYNGPLYQVRRTSDNATRDIGVLSAGGVANAATQDSFCAGTTCLITVIYDQTGRNNRLTQAPPGGFSGPAAGGYDNLANATAAPITVAGHKAYGVYVATGTGYRNNTTNGVAKGDQPEGMYAVLDGTHYNGGCCFDYGNAETNSRDNGNGTMEAIYFGNIKVWGYGSGNGPWIMADLENGLFSGVNQHYNANDPSISSRYLTAIIKGGGQPVGHPRRQRPVRRPVDLLQRSPPQRHGLQPDEEGRSHHSRHRRRQQPWRNRHLLRGRDDVRLSVGRHRERGTDQHNGGRLRKVEPGRASNSLAFGARSTTSRGPVWSATPGPHGMPDHSVLARKPGRRLRSMSLAHHEAALVQGATTRADEVSSVKRVAPARAAPSAGRPVVERPVSVDFESRRSQRTQGYATATPRATAAARTSATSSGWDRCGQWPDGTRALSAVCTTHWVWKAGGNTRSSVITMYVRWHLSRCCAQPPGESAHALPVETLDGLRSRGRHRRSGRRARRAADRPDSRADHRDVLGQPLGGGTAWVAAGQLHSAGGDPSGDEMLAQRVE